MLMNLVLEHLIQIDDARRLEEGCPNGETRVYELIKEAGIAIKNLEHGLLARGVVKVAFKNVRKQCKSSLQGVSTRQIRMPDTKMTEEEVEAFWEKSTKLQKAIEKNMDAARAGCNKGVVAAYSQEKTAQQNSTLKLAVIAADLMKMGITHKEKLQHKKERSQSAIPYWQRTISYDEKDIRGEIHEMLNQLAKARESPTRIGTLEATIAIIDRCVRMLHCLHNEEEEVLEAIRSLAISAIKDYLYQSEDCEIPVSVALHFCKYVLRGQGELTTNTMMHEAKIGNLTEASCHFLLANKLADHIRKYGTTKQTREVRCMLQDHQRQEWEGNVMRMCQSGEEEIMHAVFRESWKNLTKMPMKNVQALKLSCKEMNKLGHH